MKPVITGIFETAVYETGDNWYIWNRGYDTGNRGNDAVNRGL